MTTLRKYPSWLLLQVAIAIVALIVVVLVALEIKPLIEKKSQLEKEIGLLQSSSNVLHTQISEIRQNLSASREAVYHVSTGINFYHTGNYTSAISSYDQALALDSLNAYILNLKGYSLFKAKQLAQAERALRRSVEVSPSFAWGYFDLARVLCAEGKFADASSATKTALSLRPDLAETMRGDKEFSKLCQAILNDIK